MKIACPYCRRILKARADAMGRKFMCPSCERIFKLREFNVVLREPTEEIAIETADDTGSTSDSGLDPALSAGV